MATSLQETQTQARKSAIWYTLAVFFTKGLGFITIPLFTRIMTTGEFGLFNNFAAWQIILTAVCGLEAYATVNRARLDYHGRELQEYQFTMLTSGMALTFFLAILLWVMPSVPETVTELDRRYLWAMVAYLFFSPAFTMFQSLQRVQYHYRLSASLTFTSSLIATLLAVWLVVTLPDALWGRILGQYVPFTLLGAAFYIWYGLTGGRFRLSLLRYGIVLCIPLVISALGSQLLLLGCRIVTQHLCGADEVAYLSLATTLANIVLILTTALSGAWAPFFFDCLEAQDEARAARVFSLFAWGVGILVVAAMFLTPELVQILGGSSYQSTIWLGPSFLGTAFFSMVASQFISLETYHKDVRLGGLLTLGIGVLNLFLCWGAIVLLGFYAVGYVGVLSNVLLIAGHRVIVRRFTGRSVLSLRTWGIPGLLVLVAMPLCVGLYSVQATIIRWLCCAGLLIIALFVIKRFMADRKA